MTEQLTAVWSAIKNILEKQIPSHSYATFFSDLELISLDGNKAVLGVGNRFLLEWLKSRYINQIEFAFQKAAGRPVEIDFEIKGHIFRKLREQQMESKASVETHHVETPSVDGAPRRSRLRPEYKLESFIVGDCNQVAHAAASTVVEAPGKKYNPLFIYSATGLGKTHLLQGICHTLLSREKGTRIIYASCEEFTNLYVDCIRRKSLDEFRFRFRKADVLVIDDIHFLAGKQKTQDEFFHTFDDLLNQHKQIVISSDAHPSEINELRDKLVSRFLSGLVVRLDYPGEKMRYAILKSKATIRDLKIPDDALEYLAKYVSGNIRELEGALNRIAAYAACLNKRIDLTVVREALEHLGAHPEPKSLSIGNIAVAVAKFFEIQPSELRSELRAKRFLLPRQIAMYLARRTEKYSLSEIGTYFGGKNHATVLHAVKKITQKAREDETIKNKIASLARTFGLSNLDF